MALPKPTQEHSGRFAWVILNQSISPAFEKLLGRLSEQFGPGLLLTGRGFGVRSPHLEVREGPPYDRGTLAKRLASWARFALWAGRECAKLEGTPFLLAATNPPLLPQLALLAQKLRGFPYGLLVWDIYPEHLIHIGAVRADSWVTQMLTNANALALQGAKCIVTLSESMARTLERQMGQARAASATSVIPNWADTDLLVPLSKSENAFVHEHGQLDKLTVLYSGNIGAGHALGVVIEAADLFKNDSRLEFIFVGDGLGKRQLQDDVARRRLPNVRFVDYQPHDRLPLSLAAGDIALVSQAPGTEHLSLPSKTYSALAVGSAIMALTNQASDLAQLVESHDVGLVRSPDDGPALAVALRMLVENPEQLARMRVNARRVAVELYSEDAVHGAWLQTLAPHVTRPRHR